MKIILSELITQFVICVTSAMQIPMEREEYYIGNFIAANKEPERGSCKVELMYQQLFAPGKHSLSFLFITANARRHSKRAIRIFIRGNG